jgi:hypothetical protein
MRCSIVEDDKQPGLDEMGYSLAWMRCSLVWMKLSLAEDEMYMHYR